MQPFLKVIPILSLSIAASLPWTLVQAQTPSQTCQTLLDSDRSNLNWYLVKPLPETVATDALALQLNELEAIAASPNSLDLAIQTRLGQWLIEKPDPGPPDRGRLGVRLANKLCTNTSKTRCLGQPLRGIA